MGGHAGDFTGILGKDRLPCFSVVLMLTHPQDELRSAIIPNLLVADSQTPLLTAIARMDAARVVDTVSQTGDRLDQAFQATVRSSCLVVAGASQGLGLVTEREILSLVAQGRSLEPLSIGEVMIAVKPLAMADLTTFEAVEAKLFATPHQLLPIVDDGGQILGLITLTSLYRIWRQAYPAYPIAAAGNHTDPLEALRESESLFRNTFEQAAVGISHVSLDGQFIRLNQRFCDIAGYPEDELITLSFSDITHPDDLTADLANVQMLLTGDLSTYTMEKRYLRKDGSQVWINLTGSLVRDDATGVPQYFIAVIQDISDRKQSEAQRQAAELALQQQRDLNQLIAQITTRLVDVSSSNLDAEIASALQLLGKATEVDTSYLVKFSTIATATTPLDSCTLSMTHEWCQSGYRSNLPQVQAIPLSVFPWSMTKLLQRQSVIVPSVADVPPEATSDQAGWQQFGLTSVLAVPLLQTWGITGLIGFASFHRPLPLNQEMVQLLQMVSQAIANAQERIQSEQDLHISEERLRLALSAAKLGLYDLNLQTGETIVNPEYAIMLGYDPADFRETHDRWLERLHPDDRATIAQSYHSYVTGETAEYQVEFRLRTRTGDYKWIRSVGKIADWDEARQPLRMLGIHTDITEHKRTEAERLQAEQARLELKLLEQILDIILAGYWDWDIPNNQEYLSPGFKRMFGYADHELPNTPESWQKLIFPEDLPGVLDCFKRHVQSHGAVPYNSEVRYRHKDGSTIWVICSGQVIEWDRDGNPLRMIGGHIDITARKRVENQLRKSDAHLRAAQRIGRLGSWEFELATGKITWSDEVFRIFGLDPAAGPPTYDELLQLYLPEDRESHERIVRMGIETGEPYDLAARACRPDGSLVYIQARGEPIFDETGQLVQLIGTILDITEQKEAEAKLQRTTAQLEASNRELEAFAYSVSHDLRSPLRAIDGFSQALLEDYGDLFNEEGQDYFERIRRNIQRMGNLIDDLLSLSRVSRFKMRIGSVDLSQLMLQQIKDLQATDPARQVEVVVAPDVVVAADATLMQVVIGNLVQNAWKFTSHHATARIEFGVQQQAADQPVYFVRDDGAGFDMAYANMLFGVFQRLHNTDEFPGTGIGLATVQRAVHRHGGQVWAEAAVEAGSTFYFTLASPPFLEGEGG
jgi:PAS domain S-box-containing protein